jgi:hypothetical protein
MPVGTPFISLILVIAASLPVFSFFFHYCRFHSLFGLHTQINARAPPSCCNRNAPFSGFFSTSLCI